MFKKLLIAILTLFFGLLQLKAQQTVSGVVVDTTGSALPFVTVLINATPGKGTVTDIEGRFRVEAAVIDSLAFMCVGFTPKVVKTTRTSGVTLRVVLREADLGLPEATVVAGENPADVIMRRVIARRSDNNPEKKPEYRCHTYNKVIFAPLPNRQELDKMLEKLDTASKNTRKLLENFEKVETNAQQQYWFIMESATERSYRFPDEVQEKVLLNRVSGLQQSGLVALANAVQPFSFYNDYLNILDKSFVNPVSPNSPDLYFFSLVDTLTDGPDTVYVITYHPRKGKVFQALRGVLHIHTHNWAVQHVRAEPDRVWGNLDMTVEQVYARVKDEKTGEPVWFPAQLSFELSLPQYPAEYLGIRVSGITYVDSVTLHPDLRNRDFNAAMPIYMVEGANTRSDSMWAQWRKKAPLSAFDRYTYSHLDSLGDKKNFQLWANALNVLSTGYLPVNRWLSWDIRHFVKFNSFEGMRVGFGLTNAHGRPLELPRRLELGINWGYGLGDRVAKSGAYALWRMGRALATHFRVDARYDLQEPGALYELPPASFANRFLYARRMDYVSSLAATFSTRLWQGARLSFATRYGIHEPGYPYRYLSPVEGALEKFTFAENTLFFRYAYGEQTQAIAGNTAWRTNRLPVFELAYTSGSMEDLESPQPYQRAVAALYQTTFIRHLGRLSWRLEGGWVTPGTPLARLFTLNQTNAGNFNLFIVPNTFQSLPDTLFAFDRFVTLYLAQEVGPVLYQSRRSSPFLTLRHHMAWGDMAQKERQEIGFRTAKRPLMESGIQLDNLLRFNYVNFAYLGFGGAVFYRWGGLESTRWQDNLVWRLAMRFTL